MENEDVLELHARLGLIEAAVGKILEVMPQERDAAIEGMKEMLAMFRATGMPAPRASLLDLLILQTQEAADGQTGSLQ